VSDFSDQEAWNAVRAAIVAPNEDGFMPNVQFYDDPAYQDLTSEQLLALVPEEDDYPHSILIVADKTAISSAEMPILVISLGEERGREIRVTAAELWGIENNLAIGNMDFDEWADSADEDGVFRGWPTISRPDSTGWRSSPPR
jgi:hypothetical protein